MEVLDVVRNKAFWFLDFLKGRPVSNHINTIKFVNENYTSQRAIEYRNTSLKTLLDHAKATVSYYSRYKNAQNLSDFPVVNKVVIKENFEAFQSTTYLNKPKFTAETSGSSGTPFKLYQNKEKRHRNTADAIYFAKKAGIPIGIKIYFIRVWTKESKKSPILGWIQNIAMQEAANLNPVEIDKFINKLTRSRYEKAIWSYASALDTIAKYLESSNKKPLNCNLKAIVACSEHLQSLTKEILENRLNTSVISRYSNAENGVMGQQSLNDNTDFIANWASFHFEILKFEEDTPAEPGELGRIVLTDLFNYCMPIIRYDTGDVASMDFNDDNTPVFKSIEGRRLDLIYNSKNELISSFTIIRVIEQYTDVVQYQFIQENQAEYTVKLNVSESFMREDQLVEDVKNFLGTDSKINIVYVDEIPLLNSGKRKIVVNNYITSDQKLLV